MRVQIPDLLSLKFKRILKINFFPEINLLNISHPPESAKITITTFISLGSLDRMFGESKLNHSCPEFMAVKLL